MAFNSFFSLLGIGRKLVWVFMVFAVFASQVQAKVLEGIKLQEQIELGTETLTLNGAGKRSKFFIDLYVAALYLTEKTQDADKIIHDDQTMLLQLHVISKLISSENLSKGTEEGFNKSTNNNTQPIKEEIDVFLESFKEPIKLGDMFEIIYQPTKEITVLKNRELIKRMPVSMSFKQALFGIWLCDKPAQASLKNNLLGK